MKYRAVLLIGAPGSGKGTQGRILGQIPNFCYFSCGDVFRELSPRTAMGRTFMEYSSNGRLAPDSLTIDLWKKTLNAKQQSGDFSPEDDVLVLDGIPRNVEQAQLLEESIEVLLTLYLDCPDIDQIVQRLQRRALRENRLDDANNDVIKRRLEIFKSDTLPVLEFYGDQLVHKIDSSEPPLKTMHSIAHQLSQVLPEF